MPFLLLFRIMCIVISYIATVLGWINPCVTMVPWTTPIGISAFLATGGDWRAVVVQLLIFVLGILVYIPFVMINDKVIGKEASATLESTEPAGN